MERAATQLLDMEPQAVSIIDELWLHHAMDILRTPPQTPERAVAEQKYVVSLLAKIESETFLYPLPKTSAEQAQRLNALACQGIWQAAEPRDIEPTTYLFKDPAAWRHYLAVDITSKLEYIGEFSRSWADILYRLEDGTAWFRTR
jgi:hypothetical protein